MYVQDEGDVLFLSEGPEEGDLHGLLGEALLALAEEMHLHLVVEDWWGGGRNEGPMFLTATKTLLRKQSVCQQICAKSWFNPPTHTHKIN